MRFLKWAGQMGGGGGGGGGGGSWLLLIFHYSVSTERGRLEDEVGCSGIVWFSQVAISQLFIDQLVLRGQRGKGEGWVFEVAKGIRGRVFGMTFVQSLN